MSLRHEWKFPYQANDIAEAARKRTKYHEERRKYWEAEKVRAEKEEALEPQEDELAKAYGNSRQVNNQRAFNCAAKIAEHETAVLKLNLYARALEHNKAAGYDLDAEDVDFFGL